MTVDKVRELIIQKYKKAGSLPKIVKQEGYKYLTIADLSRFLRGVGEPVGIDKRRELGLPLEGKARICPMHGVVHDRICREPFELRMARMGEFGVLAIYGKLLQINRK